MNTNSHQNHQLGQLSGINQGEVSYIESNLAKEQGSHQIGAAIGSTKIKTATKPISSK